eukprot:scaffold7467_cov187-Amphora_coffeaeformis.AAC.2
MAILGFPGDRRIGKSVEITVSTGIQLRPSFDENICRPTKIRACHCHTSLNNNGAFACGQETIHEQILVFGIVIQAVAQVFKKNDFWILLFNHFLVPEFFLLKVFPVTIVRPCESFVNDGRYLLEMKSKGFPSFDKRSAKSL